MAQVTECDAPDCTEVHRPTPGQPWPWFSAVIQLSTPQQACEDEECGAWAWSQNGVRVDACSLEHMRIALAVKIADLTDEPASS